MCDALYPTIHGYAGASATSFMGTATIVRHCALLSVKLTLYNVVGVSTECF